MIRLVTKKVDEDVAKGKFSKVGAELTLMEIGQTINI
jgi:hypothetical protein